MSTKQVRISDPVQIHSRISEFLGEKINVVLRDGNVFLGILKTTSATEIRISNMRQKEMSFALSKIDEIYFDMKAWC